MSYSYTAVRRLNALSQILVRSLRTKATELTDSERRSGTDVPVVSDERYGFGRRIYTGAQPAVDWQA